MRKSSSILCLMVLLLIGSAQGTWAQKVIVNGHYPGGTWAELHGINDSGIAMGWGDVPSGETRMIGVSLADSRHPKWFDSGVSSDEVWGTEGGGISGSGLIVGHVKSATGEATAYAWTWTPSGPVGTDLGTLPNDDGSAAIAVNSSGTLIVGNSYKWNADQTSWWATPVVWTPAVKWHNGRQTVTWVIHALPTGGLEKPGRVFADVVLNNWSGWGVNDLGQIVGDAWSDNYDEIAVIWNPIGGSWKIQQLTHQSSFPASEEFVYTEALSINNQGEIGGDISADYWVTDLPALWVAPSPSAHSWELIELPTLAGTQGVFGVVWGINELGDIVGVSTDANGNSYATRWWTKNPSEARVIWFPGLYSRAIQMNNHGIVVGRYSNNADATGPYQAAAVAIH